MGWNFFFKNLDYCHYFILPYWFYLYFHYYYYFISKDIGTVKYFYSCFFQLIHFDEIIIFKCGLKMTFFYSCYYFNYSKITIVKTFNELLYYSISIVICNFSFNFIHNFNQNIGFNYMFSFIIFISCISLIQYRDAISFSSMIRGLQLTYFWISVCTIFIRNFNIWALLFKAHNRKLCVYFFILFIYGIGVISLSQFGNRLIIEQVFFLV